MNADQSEYPNVAEDAQHTIIVGIDESEPSRVALRWAAAYARNTGQKLVAVHVLGHDIQPQVWAYDAPGLVYDAESTATRRHREAVTALFQEVDPPVSWDLEIIEGPAAGRLLVERSSRAALLVLGTREHHGVSRLLSGSVSHHCLSHARCPVVAVPVPEHAATSNALPGDRHPDGARS